MADYFTHAFCLICFTDRKSIGLTNTNKLLSATLNGEDIYA